MSTIGMMEGAFFVGRKEIMDWINSTLDLNLAKVEDTANGAVACQLLDIMYPGQVPMHKVNWAAKQDFEFVANYKILQTCFTKLSIDRHIDVDRLISGRYMDNLEFMQWFKRFFEMGVSNKGDYDPYAVRCKGKGGDKFGNPAGAKKAVAAKVAAGAKVNAAPPAPRASSSAAPPAAPANKSKPASSTSTASHAASSSDLKGTMNQENAMPNSFRSVSPAVVASDKLSSPKHNEYQNEINSLRQQLEESRRENQELKVEYDGLEKERDFYFEKLRDVEILLQEVEDKGQDSELIANIFKILYATAEGFEQANDESGGSSIPATPSKGAAQQETFEGDAY